MRPEAFIELCEQHYGSSNPDFVKTVKKAFAGELDNEESFEDYLKDLVARYRSHKKKGK